LLIPNSLANCFASTSTKLRSPISAWTSYLYTFNIIVRHDVTDLIDFNETAIFINTMHDENDAKNTGHPNIILKRTRMGLTTKMRCYVKTFYDIVLMVNTKRAITNHLGYGI
jgi:hypothetical protein